MTRKVYATVWLGTEDETPFDVEARVTMPPKALMPPYMDEPPGFPEVDVESIVNQWTGRPVRYGDLPDDDRERVDEAVMEAAEWED